MFPWTSVQLSERLYRFASLSSGCGSGGRAGRPLFRRSVVRFLVPLVYMLIDLELLVMDVCEWVCTLAPRTRTLPFPRVGMGGM